MHHRSGEGDKSFNCDFLLKINDFHTHFALSGDNSLSPTKGEGPLGETSSPTINCFFLDWMRHLPTLLWLHSFNGLRHYFNPVTVERSGKSAAEVHKYLSYKHSYTVFYYSLYCNAFAILISPSRHARLVVKLGS